MSKEKTTKKVGSGIAAAMLALVMIGTICAGLIAVNTSSGSGGDSALDNAAKKTADTVTKFEEDSVRREAVFTDSILKRVCAAALAYKGDDADLETIASTLSFETIAVSDGKGIITASYPEGQKGKSLKDDKDSITLYSVSKGILGKNIGLIKPTESGDYLVYAAAQRTDGDQSGAINVTIISSEYGAVVGENLAESCGDNVIIEKDGKVISSTFSAADGKSISDLGVKEDDKAVTVSVDGKSYDAKAATVGDYHVLTAVEAQSGGSGSGWTQFIIVSITCACLAIIGCIVVFVAGKSKDK